MLISQIRYKILPWVESPEHALIVIEAEGGTTSHVSNLDSLRCVQVVSGVLRVLLNGAICLEFLSSICLHKSVL